MSRTPDPSHKGFGLEAAFGAGSTPAWARDGSGAMAAAPALGRFRKIAGGSGSPCRGVRSDEDAGQQGYELVVAALRGVQQRHRRSVREPASGAQDRLLDDGP